jgi:Plasmid pRiA4b ORF-3-like protein
LLEILRTYWHDAHPRDWLFPGDIPGRPISRDAVALACRVARQRSGIQKPIRLLNEARVTLAKALDGLKSFTYIYDSGDNWQYRIKVEKALVPDPDMHRPLCLDGQNACPPEDVGGVPGYVDSSKRSAIRPTRNTTTSLSGVAAASIPLSSISCSRISGSQRSSSDRQDGLGLTLTIGNQTLL